MKMMIPSMNEWLKEPGPGHSDTTLPSRSQTALPRHRGTASTQRLLFYINALFYVVTVTLQCKCQCKNIYRVRIGGAGLMSFTAKMLRGLIEPVITSHSH